MPLFSLSGLAVFLVDYQLFFIIAGVLSNVVGTIIMLETIQRHGLCPVVAGWRWDMGQVKRFAMVSGGLILAVAFLLTPQGA